MYSMYSGGSEGAKFGVRPLGVLMVIMGLWMCFDSVKAFRGDKKVKFGRGQGIEVSPKYTLAGGSLFVVVGFLGIWARTRERRKNPYPF